MLLQIYQLKQLTVCSSSIILAQCHHNFDNRPSSGNINFCEKQLDYFNKLHWISLSRVVFRDVLLIMGVKPKLYPLYKNSYFQNIETSNDYIRYIININYIIQ